MDGHTWCTKPLLVVGVATFSLNLFLAGRGNYCYLPEKGIPCPQFSDWSIRARRFLIGQFVGVEILIGGGKSFVDTCRIPES